jgi:hypothetical protein
MFEMEVLDFGVAAPPTLSSPLLARPPPPSPIRGGASR